LCHLVITIESPYRKEMLLKQPSQSIGLSVTVEATEMQLGLTMVPVNVLLATIGALPTAKSTVLLRATPMDRHHRPLVTVPPGMPGSPHQQAVSSVLHLLTPMVVLMEPVSAKRV